MSTAISVPRKSGTYKISCPECGKAQVSCHVTKVTDCNVTRYKYCTAMCRKCGHSLTGLLPR